MCIHSFVYSDESPDTALYRLDTLEVSAGRIEKNIISIVDKEEEIGIQDDINNVVFMNPGVNRVPESGSQLLVTGGSIYDNTFYINDIPMFVPAHFSGHPYMDVNNIHIPGLRDFQLITQDIAGQYYGASNCVIKIEPGIFRVNDERSINRTQALLTLGNYDAGLCVSVPFRNGKDLYQISGNVPNSYFIAYRNNKNPSYIWWDLSYYSANQNPLWYEDITLKGINSFGNAKLKEFVWLALDAYSSKYGEGKKVMPWGVASISLEDSSTHPRWKMTTGGSRQYVNQRRILGTIVTERGVERTNFLIYGERKKISIGSFLLNFDVQGQYLNWDGNAITYRKDDSTRQSFFSDEEVTITSHVGVRNSLRNFLYSIDLLGGGILNELSLFIDPGVYGRLLLDKGSINIHGGIQTSWPDIRGLPDREYRRKQIKTYMGSVAFKRELGKHSSVSLQSYIKWKDHCPALSDNPGEYRWDREEATPLFSRCVSGEMLIGFNEYISWQLFADLCRSERVVDGKFTLYEWDIPWSLRSILQLRAFKERFKCFLSGTFSEGLPYHELVLINSNPSFSNKMGRSPWYRRIDIKLQFHQPIEEHRFFTGFNLYLDLINIFAFFDRFRDWDDQLWENVREFYWNEHYIKKPVYLECATLSLGMRASFRL